MNPKEVAETYERQAKYIELFLSKIQSKECTVEEYKEALLIIGGQYGELLKNLAYHTRELENYGVVFFKIPEYNLNQPPLNADFFNNHDF